MSLAWSAARAMPKSISFTPSRTSMTLAGLMSRCAMPDACTARRWAAVSASSSHSASAGSGPCSRTASSTVSPGTYSVANHGRSGVPSLASTRGATPNGTR
ncbi:hypothetical protein HS99_0001560 [Kitasatospora aureofaciens]|uniref:Uncharacterized protein n=1 Tax=Kitasatospora aureofaciens TaxID=1894 RepID=A0A1E7NFG2_KITAU|nr:hypothetical protein HS99_0001560 [Kitasatospora aureofaciens]